MKIIINYLVNYLSFECMILLFFICYIDIWRFTLGFQCKCCFWLCLKTNNRNLRYLPFQSIRFHVQNFRNWQFLSKNVVFCFVIEKFISFRNFKWKSYCFQTETAIFNLHPLSAWTSMKNYKRQSHQVKDTREKLFIYLRTCEVTRFAVE